MESTNTRRKADVHRHVEMAFHPEFLSNTRPYPTPSNVAAEVSGKTMPIYIYPCSENNIRHMESKKSKIILTAQKNNTSFSGKFFLPFPFFQ